MKPANTPMLPPLVMLFEKSSDGMTKKVPISIRQAKKISFLYSFSLKKTGSKNVTNKGNVEKVSKPTATVEIWIE